MGASEMLSIEVAEVEASRVLTLAAARQAFLAYSLAGQVQMSVWQRSALYSGVGL